MYNFTCLFTEQGSCFATYGLLYDAVISSKKWRQILKRLATNKLEAIQKKTVVPWFEVLLQNVSGEIEEYHGNTKS
jgi:hypothetical protein